MKLGVNIDHIATLRQARKGEKPDPIEGALVCEKAGADSIVCHLREDRRHIQDKDLSLLKKVIKIPLNLEMAATDEIIKIALKEQPSQVTLVPEKREELTTEGGLDVKGNLEHLKKVIARFKKAGISVSLFVDPEIPQIKASKEVDSQSVELHTGSYAETEGEGRAEELKKLREATEFAISLGLKVDAGHGLNYENVVPICQIPGIERLNIGHSIIARAVFAGLEEAVKEMLNLLGGENANR
ncbi:MAG: pyridoxine 5'-phosphate synthase [Candidatus Omnitrophica bacterium]|nr:pyridoxine 5'-phosphate synthase [Candidatus Omnitrophota bacterium]